MSSSVASELAGDGAGLAAVGSPAPSGLQAALPRRTAWARSLSLRARDAPPLLATSGAPPLPSSLPGHGAPMLLPPLPHRPRRYAPPLLPPHSRGAVRRGRASLRSTPDGGEAGGRRGAGAGERAVGERAWQALRLGPLALPLSHPLCLAAGGGAASCSSIGRPRRQTAGLGRSGGLELGTAGRQRGWPDPMASSSARGGGSRIWQPRRPAMAVVAPSSSFAAPAAAPPGAAVVHERGRLARRGGSARAEAVGEARRDCGLISTEFRVLFAKKTM
ncbi:hypothetical protein PVAP13_1KG126677 [Panicum virgatum]|uniref:Uncharacterized protein n=1 Tax=Panicum virgatum TaxID=38727 RepID=A0A8T0X5L4_PANVG|nr:hypothetical protein PVAP13_1KG126677 [Panicum virgatum]